MEQQEINELKAKLKETEEQLQKEQRERNKPSTKPDLKTRLTLLL